MDPSVKLIKDDGYSKKIYPTQYQSMDPYIDVPDFLQFTLRLKVNLIITVISWQSPLIKLNVVELLIEWFDCHNHLQWLWLSFLQNELNRAELSIR